MRSSAQLGRADQHSLLCQNPAEGLPLAGRRVFGTLTVERLIRSHHVPSRNLDFLPGDGSPALVGVRAAVIQ